MFRFTSLPVDCENSPSWVMLMGILYYITIYSEDQQGNMFTQMYFGLISGGCGPSFGEDETKHHELSSSSQDVPL